VSSPITLSEASNAITLGVASNVYEPKFAVNYPIELTPNIISGIPDLSIDPLAYNPYHVAGRIASNIPQSSKGRYSFTVSKPSTGFFVVTFNTAHPDGANFIALASGEGYQGSAWNIVHQGTASAPHVNTSTSVTFIVRDNNFAEVSGAFNFVVLA